MAQAKYTPIGDRVNLPVAILQATSALDIAARFAVQSKDSDALIRIAEVWVRLSERLVYDDEEEMMEEEAEKAAFGFSLVSDIEGEEENNGRDDCEDCGDTEDDD